MRVCVRRIEVKRRVGMSAGKDICQFYYGSTEAYSTTTLMVLYVTPWYTRRIHHITMVKMITISGTSSPFSRASKYVYGGFLKH